MTQAFITIKEACALFGVSRRTIGRKLAKVGQDGINASQIVQDGQERRIAFAELLRVF
jgi:excisionase family DNA binding protein